MIWTCFSFASGNPGKCPPFLTPKVQELDGFAKKTNLTCDASSNKIEIIKLQENLLF